MGFKNHAVTRTSPYGQPFVGKCIKCGKEGLTLTGAQKSCPGKLTERSEILDMLEGKPAQEK